MFDKDQNNSGANSKKSRRFPSGALSRCRPGKKTTLYHKEQLQILNPRKLSFVNICINKYLE